LAVICLTLKTSKTKITTPSEISSTGVFYGMLRITDFMGFSDLGKKE
jgi:hypothetical protein